MNYSPEQIRRIAIDFLNAVHIKPTEENIRKTISSYKYENRK